MDGHDRLLESGRLWPSLVARSADASRKGALQSIPTKTEVIEQAGVSFVVRVMTDHVGAKSDHTTRQSSHPMTMPDPDLFVAELSPTHVAFLNKVSLVAHQVVIATRSFEAHESPLTHRDCEALLIALAEIDGLIFYDAGSAAGTAGRHKHLQLIPLPASTGPRLPIETLFHSLRIPGEIGLVPTLPFLHAYAPVESDWLDPEKKAGATLLACYRALLRAVGFPMRPGNSDTVAPYNLLMTRRWLLLVPRSQDYFEGIPINALSFAGEMFVRDTDQLELLRKHGPMTALQFAALPHMS
ncbi:putative Ap4A phosphorylase II [Nitrospira sp. KM1]|uniref:ATP adenylyltransferase family protein n=1 Tax=Nitrospira sp. KM1 TaxID=1936990 RepID=UPI0013A71330|nr:phosphorylase [Nitrospira sp. KM1]BCA52924.1 putative Ap4A phosphorylase II [Nitrospira sp. KM1]